MFSSRRSTVYLSKGIVASSQPLASAAGVKILSLGGNAVDAAIATSAVLCITEPGLTGIGGDCFALFHDAKTNTVQGINGCGRSAKNLSVEDVIVDGPVKRILQLSVYAVTVPGAIAGWQDAYKKWGSGNVTWAQILEPAIEIAENGFAVHEIAAYAWQRSENKLKAQNPGKDNAYLFDGKAPVEGQFVTNPRYAKALRLVAEGGAKAFYEGPIAEAIINTTDERGHKLTLDDLRLHTSEFVDPISVEFGGHKVWEIPPNGLGIVVLIALGIIRELRDLGVVDVSLLTPGLAEYLHLLVEVLKIAFYDGDELISDPHFDPVPVDHILSKEHLRLRAKLFSKDKVLDLTTLDRPIPDPKQRSDTVYLTVTDKAGNACSFINSVFYGFGSAILVEDYGFCLQNRGANFNLLPGLPNCLEGGKRPYHTIIPAMVTDLEGNLKFTYGNMGGFMQPVGHVLHFLNVAVFNMTPQQSIDFPRICLEPANIENDQGRGGGGPVASRSTIVLLEDGIAPEVNEQLQKLGHSTEVLTGYKRTTFGRAQIIQNLSKDGKVLHAAGSDPRGDGAAIPLV